jgi:iron complex outermembrane receptor protein
VTILDRQFIRASGARDVADLLRLVPGFQTTLSFETDAPMATYHGRTDDWANRIQVLVDGRSVYAGHLQGSAGLGWQTLALDDVERIEVLRGSNSAAYGARAFLGVVNIVSRDVRETLGGSASLSLGENGVRDSGFRWGWGSNDATYRISADVRADDGLRNAFGKSEVTRVNLSSHFNVNRESELSLRLGSLGIEAGRGTPGDAGNNARIRFMGSRFAQADWRTTLDENRDFSISASHTEHQFRDNFRLETTAFDEAFGAPYSNTLIDFSGTETNDALSLQYTVRSSPTVRYVVGTELRREELNSRSSFDATGGVVTSFLRLFGNLEWRVAPQWILNAGAMAERISDGSDTLSPRMMLNWQLAEGQTVRAGISTASRPPSGYEKYSDVKYYDRNRQNPLVWTIHDGALTAERVLVKELGYYAKLPRYALTADIRAFHEEITNGIANNRPDPPAVPEIYKNTESSTIGGLEYQINFQPTAATRLFWSQTWTHIDVKTSVDRVRLYRTEGGAAPRAASLAVSHSLSPDWELSASYNFSDGSTLLSSDVNSYYLLQRTDMRLARAFKLGKNKAELALTVQNLGPASMNSDRKFFFDQRAMLTLRVGD